MPLDCLLRLPANGYANYLIRLQQSKTPVELTLKINTLQSNGTQAPRATSLSFVLDRLTNVVAGPNNDSCQQHHYGSILPANTLGAADGEPQ